MSTSFHPYRADPDYLRIRQFLIDTFPLHGGPFNWLIERWNFCRYFVVPIHTHFNVNYFGVPTRPHTPFRDELPGWEAGIGVWENDGGEIVGVVNSENEEAGEAWFQLHPDYTHLGDEMVEFAEMHLADRAEGVAYVKLYIIEGSEMEVVAQARGYRALPDHATPFWEYTVTPQSAPELPPGFVIKTVAEHDDVEQRRRAKAMAFGPRYGPSQWEDAESFRIMQQAPDYRADLDLVILAPNGEQAAFTTIWVDEANGYGNFEPVGTVVDYQGLGLGRALIQDGARRMAALGLTRSYMTTTIPFYAKIGFRELPRRIVPWIKHFAA